MLLLTMFSSVALAGGITDRETPYFNADIIFEKRFGRNYQHSPTPPIYDNGCLYLTAGNTLYKLDASDGSTIKKTEMTSDSIYTTIGVLVADGKVFVPLDGGIIEAYDQKSLERLWTYRSGLKGQAISHIVYADGVVYTGFWTGEETTAEFVAVPAECNGKENTALWTYAHKGGFYWSECILTDNYVLVSHDDGANYSESDSGGILALDKKNGEKAAELTLTGDIRSGIRADDKGNYFVSGKAGFVCKFRFDDENAEFSDQEFFWPDGSVTSTPLIYKGRMYVGSSAYPNNYFYVVDTETMTTIYKEKINGYAQAEMLLSTAYESRTGKVYIYTTYNSRPGGITVFEDSPGQKTAVKTELYAPVGREFQEHCVSPISVGEDGTLYYKNDSGCIFAVGQYSPLRHILRNTAAFLKRLVELVKLFVSEFHHK